jgi:hypothetical protein
MTEGQRLGHSVRSQSQATTARDLTIPSWILERRDLGLEDKLFLALREANNPDRVERQGSTPDLTVKGWIMDLPGLAVNERFGLALFENVSCRTGLVYVGDGTAAARLGLHPKTIKRLVRRLKKRRLLRAEIGGGGENHLAGYRVVRPSARRERPVPVLGEPPVPARLEQPAPPRLVQLVLLYEKDQLNNVEKDHVNNGEKEQEPETPPPASAPAQSEDLEAAVLSLLFPRGASQNQQRAIAGPVATLRAAGATAEFLALYLGRDLEGQPWVRLDRALAAWCADRSSRIKAEAEAEGRRRIAEAGKAAAGAPKDPPSPRLPGLAEAIRRLGVVEVFLRDQPGFKAKIISASADGILVESPAFPSPSRSTLRTDADLSRWNFGAAETGSPEAHP